ncbi:MAG: polysaccharide biosynthesis protein [Bacteroidales bacterium]|nr:polysaccharide biosynthesis protein [Bacteroidales bacterium]
MNQVSKLINWYFSKKTLPFWGIVLLDSLIVLFSYYLVFWFFFRGSGLENHFFPATCTFLLFLFFHLIAFRIFHTYSGIIRYSSFVDLGRVGFAMGSSGLAVILIHYITNEFPGTFVFLNVRHIVLAIIMATLLMWAIRVVVKFFYDNYFRADENALRVFIYGVQDGGVGLAKNIRNEKPARFVLKGFISHDPRLNYTRLMGEKVYQVNDHLPEVLKEKGIDAVLVAPKRNDVFRNDEQLQDYIIGAGVSIYMAHEADKWEKGEDVAPQLREVSIEDLLPREQIQVDMESVGSMLKGRKILITGSAGSIGSEMVRQIAIYEPAELMLIDQAETPQHDIRLMMAHDFPDIKAATVVGSIANEPKMRKIFSEFKPDYVLHAAAYKHVPMMEDNPFESIHNNVYGTKVIADLSVEFGVKKFVMISTDKAVNPTNVMGCSKRICEIYVQSLNKAEMEGRVKGNTQFVTTRFGNVLGSNGSVIPLFEKQIREGGPVTVTDPNIIRYFMLIPEACKLVLEAGTKGKGGEIFVFDMGKPVKIADLAKRMILLSGATNVEIKFTGLREGEKLYEEVLNDAEVTKPSFHEKIRIAEVREYDYFEVCKQIEDLITISGKFNNMDTVRSMKSIVPEYKSNNSVYSVLD